MTNRLAEATAGATGHALGVSLVPARGREVEVLPPPGVAVEELLGGAAG